MNATLSSLRPSLLACAACLLGTGMIEPSQATAADRIYAVQNRASTPNFQLFLNLRSDSTTASSGALFSPAGGVYAAEFRGDTLYATELPNGQANNFLVTIPHQGPLVGQGQRVSANPIGFTDIEGLATVEGTLYAVSVNYSGHHTRLITINHTTGVGTLIGTTGTDILLVGLAYDLIAGVLYGAGIPFASESQAKLYRVNSATAEAIVIGPLGAAIQSLSWDAELGLIGAFAKLYRINPQTGAATQIGTNDFTDNKPATVNGIYALAAHVPPDVLPFTLRSIAVTNNDVVLSWNSASNVAYQVESRASLSSGAWANLGGVIVANGVTTAYTNVGGGSALMNFYRVKSGATF